MCLIFDVPYIRALTVFIFFQTNYRADSRFVPSQRETALLCTDMRDSVALYRRISLAGRKPRISPELYKHIIGPKESTSVGIKILASFQSYFWRCVYLKEGFHLQNPCNSQIDLKCKGNCQEQSLAVCWKRSCLSIFDILKLIIFQLTFWNAFYWMKIIVFRFIFHLYFFPKGTFDNIISLVHVMAWCRQATSHYMNQWWPRSVKPYDATRL